MNIEMQRLEDGRNGLLLHLSEFPDGGITDEITDSIRDLLLCIDALHIRMGGLGYKVDLKEVTATNGTYILIGDPADPLELTTDLLWDIKRAARAHVAGLGIERKPD